MRLAWSSQNLDATIRDQIQLWTASAVSLGFVLKHSLA